MLAAALSAALLAITLVGCATGSGSNGDNVARDWAHTLAEEYAYDINGLRENRTADYLAANIVSPEPNPDGSSIVVEALSWTGVSEDAVDRLAATLANATPETLKADVLAAFPEDYLFIDTVVDSGRLIVAMRATDNSDCIVVMRDADGTVEQAGFDPIWAEPGETGCTTGLVTNPPL